METSRRSSEFPTAFRNAGTPLRWEYPNGIVIRLAPELEAQRILRDPTIHYRAFTPPVAGDDVYWLTQGAREALIHARLQGKIMDLHIAVPWRSRTRQIMNQILDWCHDRGAAAVMTAAPYERTALCGMLRSLGFVHLGKSMAGDGMYVKTLITVGGKTDV